MLAQIYSCGLNGVDGVVVTVEIDVTSGNPNFFLVGLPDMGVKESKERVYSAINNASFPYPMKRITVNLAPANLKKEGTAYDLPIAVGILIASENMYPTDLEKTMMVGELSLNGDVKGINGILPMVLAAKDQGFDRILIPEANKKEGGVVSGIEVIPVANLVEVVELLQGNPYEAYTLDPQEQLNAQKATSRVDFSEIKGQDNAKRALEIAAAGSHNLLMHGPPGSGKTMLAKAFASILPDMTLDEVLEVSKIYSISGLLPDGHIMSGRPFRSPHHTISNVSLIGGGQYPKPGEVSLAHLGVLYLDELPEFQRTALEVLRQPMEDGSVTISRVHATVTFPASFSLIASMNPCPCGYHQDPHHECTCTQKDIQRYQSKISGPLMDRIDIRVGVPATTYHELERSGEGESSERVKKRVNHARQIQNRRFAKEKGLYFNSQLTPKHLKKYCVLGKNEKTMMETYYNKMKLSARGYHRILKLSRTIADLDGSEKIETKHLLEAVQYRTEID